MLRLENITKDYKVADTTVAALRGIDLAFRKNEFVSVLGPSGCGKTTLLNIIGGLDKYTSGEMFINGKSTRHFNDADWDVYRNHRIGFVFQSYNLIPHPNGTGQRRAGFNHSGRRQSRAHETCQARVGQGGFGRSVQQKAKSAFGRTMPTRGYCPRVGQRTRYFACRRTDGRA